MDPPVDSHPFIWDQHDFHLHGRYQSTFGYRRYLPDLVDRTAFYRHAGRYFGHVAERICLTGFFLVAPTRRRGFWFDLRLCVVTRPMGDVDYSMQVFDRYGFVAS